MTKKHFEAIARIIKDRFEFIDRQRVHTETTEAFDMGYCLAAEAVAEELAAVFAEVNPNFDRDKFLTACGL